MSLFTDLLFPKRCVGCKKLGSYICSNCLSHIELFQDFVCPMCLRRSINGKTHPGCIKPHGIDGLACGVVYKGIVKRILFSLKYKPHIADLRHACGRLFFEMISQNELFMGTLPQHPIVMPIPLSSKKHKLRGYNQSELLAAGLARDFNLKIKTQILKRMKDTKPQFTLNKDQRFKNVLNVFEVSKVHQSVIQGKTILLVDDLATSCATLRECAKVLKRAGAKKVYGVAFAREL